MFLLIKDYFDTRVVDAQQLLKQNLTIILLRQLINLAYCDSFTPLENDRGVSFIVAIIEVESNV